MRLFRLRHSLDALDALLASSEMRFQSLLVGGPSSEWTGEMRKLHT